MSELPRLTSRFLHPRYQEKRDVHTGHELILRHPVSIADLVGYVPPDKSISSHFEIYNKLMSTPLNIISMHDRTTGKKQYMLVGTANALETNCLLYFAAPYKSPTYGIDTDDVINDGEDLYDQTDPRQVKCLEGHRKIPGWTEFEASGSRERILGQLTRNWFPYDGQFEHMNPTDVIHPFLRWEESNDGLCINLAPPETELSIQVARMVSGVNPDSFDVATGLAWVTAFTSNLGWPVEDGYMITAPKGNSFKVTNSIGPVQTMAYVFHKVVDPQSHDLERSRLLQALTDYANTGKKPRRKRRST